MGGIRPSPVSCRRASQRLVTAREALPLSQKFFVPLVLLLAGLVGIATGRLFVASEPAQRAPPELTSGTWLTPSRPLPAFHLVDQDGQPASEQRFVGRWTLVFFGFTHCPEACPTTLATLATVRRGLAAKLPTTQLPDILLVSVDPERDTPAVLNTYLASFGPGFSGLTGDARAINSFTAALGIPHRKLPMDSDYMIDHSLSILLVKPDGDLTALLSPPHVAATLLSDYLMSVAATGG